MLHSGWGPGSLTLFNFWVCFTAFCILSGHETLEVGCRNNQILLTFTANSSKWDGVSLMKPAVDENGGLGKSVDQVLNP